MIDKFINLDESDRRLITILQRNPRASYLELANDTGMSASTARRRTERLVSTGALKFVAVPVWSRIGLELVAIIGISVELRRLRDVASKLADMDEVCWVAMTAGVYDLIVQVVLPRNEDLIQFVTERVAATEGIRDLQTLMVPEFAKTFDQYRVLVEPDPLYGRTVNTSDGRQYEESINE